MRRELEGGEQAALFDWVEIAKGTMPELALLFHIPNGGLRSKTEAARMKRQGVKAGVSDLFLPCSRGRWHGLFIELKAAGGRPSADQIRFIEDVRAQGYRAEICVGWTEAADLLKKYLRTRADGSIMTPKACDYCGREIIGDLKGEMLGETMVCQDCAETIVMPALLKAKERDAEAADVRAANR